MHSMAVLQSISILQLQNQLFPQPFHSPLRHNSARRIPTLRKTTCQSADTCKEIRITAATPAELELNTAPPVYPVHLSPILRRQACIAAWSSAVTALSGGFDASWGVHAARAAASVSVGSYLPSAGVDNLVLFKPDQKATPALRAGNVTPYQFFLPPTWTQARIANILSGNYCQPKCAEPWIEVKFEDPKQGTLLVVASPMVRLTNKAQQKIEQIGTPDKIIAALGSFVTGDSFDPDEVVETRVEKRDDQTYYSYVLETPYARSGTHNLAVSTAKGNTVLLFVISASDAQWASSKDTLKKLADSFSV